jgi:SET domain-containing protein
MSSLFTIDNSAQNYLRIEENKNMKIYHSYITTPSNIYIKNIKNNYSLVSLKKYNIGDVIFYNNSMLFSTNAINQINVYIMKDNRIHDTIILDFLVHTVNRGNNIREYYGFDTFCNHSCEPNTEVVQLDETNYIIRAIKNIDIEDEITQDYTTFDSMLDNTEFICGCMSKNCKKIIKG